MAVGDKIPDAAEDLLGKAKEAAGKATHNDDLIASGEGDQVKAKIVRGDDEQSSATDH